MSRLPKFILVVLLVVLVAGCVSTNSRVGINKNRSVDIVYTAIILDGATAQTSVVDETKTNLTNNGFKVTSKAKANDDVVITATKHLADISDLKSLKINDTTNLIVNFKQTITAKSGYDELILSGTMPVLDPPTDPEEEGSTDIRSRLTLKLPAKAITHNADIEDGTVYEWEGNDAEPAAFNIKVNMPKVIAVTNINVTSTTATIKKGNALQLSPTVQPTNASNKELRYSTSNKNIATVSASGKIQAVAAGTVKITIANSTNAVKREITITVTN